MFEYLLYFNFYNILILERGWLIKMFLLVMKNVLDEMCVDLEFIGNWIILFIFFVMFSKLIF